MPEAAVYEHGNVVARERDIGAATEGGQSVVDSKPKPGTMEQRPQRDLRNRVTLTLALHAKKCFV
jgi:hypothetical protein